MNLQDFIFYVHLAGLAIAAGGVLYADTVGLAWMRGKSLKLEQRTLDRLHNVISYALTVLILSGLYMFWPMREYLLQQPLFLLKLFFVATLVINSIAIDRLMLVATKVSFEQVSAKGQIALFLSGALSVACWLGAAIAACILFGWPF